MLDKTDGRVLAGDWTAERVKLLEQRWAEGLSASQIASELGGVTRSAVIGKIHRCGFQAPAAKAALTFNRPRRTAGWKPAQWRPPMTREERMRRQRERELLKLITQPQPLPKPTPTTHVFLNLTFDQLSHGDKKCRYLAGDDRLYCGQPTIKGSSWCGHCFGVVFAPRRAAA